MRTLGAAVVIALSGALVAACGGEESARDRVDAYIRSANAVQKRFATAFKDANVAYQDFARSALSADEAVARLTTARDEIERARSGVAALRAPEEARALQSRLVRIFDMNLSFAEETLQLAAYQDGSAEALAPLERVDARLQRELRGQKDPVGQARALDRFSDGLARVLRRLRALEVPYVLLPPHGDQVRRLKRTQELSQELEVALRAQKSKDVARLLQEFRSGSRTRRTRRTLARQALNQYNRRYRQLSDAYADLNREQAELDQSLD